jgi:hypothetical protein
MKKQLTAHEATHANHFGYTDTNPFEIIRVVSDKTIEIRSMNAERDFEPNIIPGGFAGHCTNNTESAQKWKITSDETAPVIRIRFGKKGWKDANGNRYGLDTKPRKFYDYNF